jgi:hypothetical protein
MPENVSIGHFGNELCCFILNQYHQCQVTQPLLHEQLLEFGIDISTGQINNILLENKESFHEEKLEILKTALEVSAYIQVDDTGARHDGKNGYCTQLGNKFFAWFQSTNSKSRINFLEILSSAYSGRKYTLNEDAFLYMEKEGLPQKPFEILKNSIKKDFSTLEEWLAWLKSVEIKAKRHVKIATEAALFSGVLQGGLNRKLVILSDDAGQFKIPKMKHALCWIHIERHIKKILPLSEEMRQAQEKILEDFWSLYRIIKEYKTNPTRKSCKIIISLFNELFQRQTTFAILDNVLKRIFSKKKELLVVLGRPEIPLHNNGSETDIREYVKRRKISGGTRSLEGQRCRDTFASLKKTCRKLGISFNAYLKDRISGGNRIPRLEFLVKQAAKESSSSFLPIQASA